MVVDGLSLLGQYADDRRRRSRGGGTRCGMGAGPSMPLSTSRMPALFFVITPPVVAVPDMGIRSAHPDRFDEPGGFPAYVMRIRASGASHASYCVRYSSATPAISSLTYDTPSSLCSSRPVPKIFCPRRHESRTTAADGGSRPYPLTPTCVSCMLPPTTADSTYGTFDGLRRVVADATAVRACACSGSWVWRDSFPGQSFYVI